MRFNHSLPEMMHPWWRNLFGVLPRCYTVDHSVSIFFWLIMDIPSPWIEILILWMSADFVMNFIWVFLGEVSFLTPKIAPRRTRKDTSFETFQFVDSTHFTRNFESRLHDVPWLSFEVLLRVDVQCSKNLMHFLCSFIPFRKKVWFSKRVWNLQYSIGTA